jgi:hydrogenase nickel incorporation protein HypB
MAEQIKLGKKILSRNDLVAGELRELFQKGGIAVVNMVSSPGSGKTAILEKTLGTLGMDLDIAVIEGDVSTENDARRIARTGIPVHQINTGGACHLDAEMIRKALVHFDLEKVDLLIIENVGNLVCPSAFDLGEDLRVVIVSVTEGDDKPLKYPAMFHTADLMVVNKLDLLEHTDFSLEAVKANARSLNPGIDILQTSCQTGEGLEEWTRYILSISQRIRQRVG